MHILFLVPYPLDEAPSQRFRFEQYFDALKRKGHTYMLQSFLNKKTWELLYRPQKTLLKAYGIINGFVKRFFILFKVYQFDFVFIHREASPLGPPVFEWVIAKVFRKKIIYDFDDAIWLPNTSAENAAVSKIKWHSKVAKICKWSYKVSCGNQYLCNFAKQHSRKVILNPTTIDTVYLHNPTLYSKTLETVPPSSTVGKEKEVVVGWTGSHSTLAYLNLILPALQRLEKKYKFIFSVIADKKPSLGLNNLQFRPWNKETEIQDLMKLDIGLMPLSNDLWSRGKCGFKALQYMALGIPAIASPTGVNTEIIKNGIDGYLCNTSEDWYNKIEALILDPELRKAFGKKGREKVVGNYSVLSNVNNFLGLFE